VNNAPPWPPRAAIRDIVTRHLRSSAPIEDDTRLLSGGLLDSMALVDMLLALQEALGVRIQASDIDPNDFDSIAAIAATLARSRSAVLAVAPR
jgi:acyl carrier protein